jgi:hypothetical protein
VLRVKVVARLITLREEPHFFALSISTDIRDYDPKRNKPWVLLNPTRHIIMDPTAMHVSLARAEFIREYGNDITFLEKDRNG